ncbi:hypothetical protein WJX75_001278 [Coccomyxa subellipsoidea]|uniref:Glycosyl transferase CAP10 domain-containing protein n=1 Tax=Coccomyxa subellipsoidea TaxID=248742 RepID=A0ABR2YLG8_9CHLO
MRGLRKGPCQLCVIDEVGATNLLTPKRSPSSQRLLRQPSGSPVKEGAVWGRTWGKVAAIVALAHLLVVLYVLLGSKRGAASMTGLFSGRAVKPHALGHGASLDANASMWHPQSGEWGEGDPETDAEAESQRMWREGDLLQLTSHRKQGARQLWGKGMSLKRPSQKTSWWHQARAFVGQKLGVEDGAKEGRTTSHPEVLVDKCAEALHIPKVAMMFLTRGDLHQEPVWDLWFRHAEGLVPISALKVHGCGTAFVSHLRSVCGHAAGDGPIQRQHLFNVYVHVGANEVNFKGFANTSVFYGRDIVDRVHVEWGSFSLVAALKNLLHVALEDPLNQKFMLLSESGIPLYPAETLWVELMVEEKSRVNACELGTLNNMYHRWAPEMESEALKVSHWRKSSQWAVLRRDHAQIIADDTVVADAFTKHCYMEWRDNVWRDCYSDEHYLGTLLASRGLDNETDCLGHITYTHWSYGEAHPKAFTPEDINADALREMRQPQTGCNAAPAIVTASAQFVPIEEVRSKTCGLKPIDFSYSLGYHCPMMARKFPKETAATISQLLAECSNQLNIVTSPKCAHLRHLLHSL